MDSDDVGIIEEEATVSVPINILREILEKVNTIDNRTMTTQEEVSNLGSQLRKFEGLQGARDQIYNDSFRTLVKAVAAVDQDFHFPLKTIEDLDSFDKSLKKCSIEVEKMVIKCYPSLLDKYTKSINLFQNVYASKMPSRSLKVLLREEVLAEFSKDGRYGLRKFESSKMLSIVIGTLNNIQIIQIYNTIFILQMFGRLLRTRNTFFWT